MADGGSYRCWVVGGCSEGHDGPASAATRRWVEGLCVLGSHFAGVPLALALLLLLGIQGWLGAWSPLLAMGIGDPRLLWLAFIYFQAALAVVLLADPVLRIDPSLVEASDLLGRHRVWFWLRVGLPSLAPSLVEVFALLVANAGAAYATPYALAGVSVDLVAVKMVAMITGDLFEDPRLVQALGGILMLVLLSVVLTGRWISRQLERRLK